MRLMLQQPQPDDFVVATGKSYSVREFLDQAASVLDLDWAKYVDLDPRYVRPTEVNHLLGDSSKAQRVLGFKPKVGFPELVSMMVLHDFELAKQELTLVKAGHNIEFRGAASA
jgi:GDPmannose 4,6-dehydratase